MRRALALLVLAVALTGCAGEPADSVEPSAGGSASADLGELRTAEELPNDHVEGPVDYDEVPPLGGEHNARWLACAVYDEPVPVELAVHSLEHGGVWLTHRGDVPAPDVDRLVRLAQADEEYVLVSPLPEQRAPVLATAWGVQLAADTVGDPRLAAFVERYAGGDQGGEPGAPCRTSGLSLEDARAAVGGD